MNFLTHSLAYTLMSLMSLMSASLSSTAPSAQALPTNEGAKNLGGSTYFSWKIKNPISGLDNAPKVIGYACLTRDTIGGMAKNAYAYRYAIKARPKSEQWWLEYQDGIAIAANESRYSGTRMTSPLLSITQLQTDVTDGETGWFKRDFDLDDLGQSCINGGVSSAMEYLEKTHGINIRIETTNRR
jgi:hypothetical protein